MYTSSEHAYTPVHVSDTRLVSTLFAIVADHPDFYPTSYKIKIRLVFVSTQPAGLKNQLNRGIFQLNHHPLTL
jgi:hypothetical protein